MPRDFMQMVSLTRPDGGGGDGDEVMVEYDPEWLAILKASHYLLKNTREQVNRTCTPFQSPTRASTVPRELPMGIVIQSARSSYLLKIVASRSAVEHCQVVIWYIV